MYIYVPDTPRRGTKNKHTFHAPLSFEQQPIPHLATATAAAAAAVRLAWWSGAGGEERRPDQISNLI